MAAEPGPKLDKTPRIPPPRQDKRLTGAYFAKIVSAPELWRFVHAKGGGEGAILWVADQQLALITTLQLHIAGVGRGGVRRRLENGTLHRRHRGVYLVGHPIPLPGANELGAVLACGDRAFISHRSAAGLWGLARAPLEDVELTVVERGCRSRSGLRVHRVDTLDAVERAPRGGTPLGSPAPGHVDDAPTAHARRPG